MLLPASGTGQRQFALAARLTAGAWVLGVLLLAILYARPTASGAPLVLQWHRYFFLAALHKAAGAVLLSLPFLAVWLVAYRTPIRDRRWLLVQLAHAMTLTGGLVLDHLDHEISRFMGMRLSLELIAAYVHVHTSVSAILDSLAMDRGGAYLPLAIWIAVPAFYLVWAVRLIRRRWQSASEGANSLPRWAAVLGVIVLLVGPYVVSLKTGRFRTLRVQPAVIGLAREWWQGHGVPTRPPDLDSLASDYQRRWLAESGDAAWTFPVADYPYVREPTGPSGCSQDPGWNVILLQLESFRGWNVGHLNPTGGPSPTPFIDSLAADPNGASWDRFSTFGWPTMVGVLSAHASVLPHSRRFIPTAFANIELLGFPRALRDCGYQAEVFTVSDPDWDNLRVWLERWYDRLWFYPEARHVDRPAFRKAAVRIRELGRSGRPFLATLLSISNHSPFRLREPGFDQWGSATPEARMKGTMRYTDAVVEELIRSLRDEPWFDRTVIIVTADHGYNLGEHDGEPTRPNVYREALWGPLVIWGKHPRIPRGVQHDVSSLLDLAPTVADLAGIRVRNPWMGHSLIGGRRPAASLAFTINEQAVADTGSFSLVTDERLRHPLLFDAEGDYRQQRDISGQYPDVVRGLLRRAASTRDLNDYLVASDRVWRPR